MLSDTLLETVRHVWSTLRPTGVKMAMIGGIALSVWEHMRATKDADLLVGVELDDLPSVLETLRQAGIRPIHDPPLVDVGIARILPLQFEPPETFIEVRIDFLFAESEFQREALSRSAPVYLPNSNLSVDVVTCEDLILFKLLAGRIIDRSDAAYLLRYNRDSLDLSYLMSWSDRLNVTKELTPIWEEAFPGESPGESPPPPS